MSRKTALIIVIFVVVAIVAFIGVFLVLGGLPGVDTPVPGVMEPTPTTCPLTGQETESTLLVPLAVCIDNIRQARPQSGLDRADIIYEVLAEGGIPRFLAIYYCGAESSDRIGPIRSARTYFISLAQQFDAVLAHAGGSPQALQQIRQGEIRSLNQFDFPRAYFRDPARRAPHNLYTNTSRLLNAARDAGFEGSDTLQGPSFDGQRVPGPAARTITVRYPTTRVSYEYDEANDVYLRFMNGEPHRDAETGEQLRAKNVIVQTARHVRIDAAGRLWIDLVGEGNTIVFTGGNRIGGTWTRDSEAEPFRYEDAEGEVIRLTPGQTWVEIVREDTPVSSEGVGS